MAIMKIPIEPLPYEEVTELPEIGEVNKVYGIKVTDFLYKDYSFYNNEWNEVNLDNTVFSFLFEQYQDSVNDTIADLTDRIEALEGNSMKLLYEDKDITLTEAMATIGKTVNISTNIEVKEGMKAKVTLENLTINGEPIRDATGDITFYGLTDWDWQGGDLYSDVFGNGAYFAFGTKPLNTVATQVTLGFVNEADGFLVRNLHVGHIRVELYK